jgi:hypothetical protein
VPSFASVVASRARVARARLRAVGRSGGALASRSLACELARSASRARSRVEK